MLRFSVLLVVLMALGAAAAAGQLGIGQPATPEEIAGWNIDVRPDGAGLPAGSGSVEEGKTVFTKICSGCHTTTGAPAALPAPGLVGGRGSLTFQRPVRTIGSYWPYATTLFDYIRRAMPFTAPQSLTDHQVYAVTAYLLFLNGIVPPDAVMNAQTLPQVGMPNRNGFQSQWHGGG